MSYEIAVCMPLLVGAIWLAANAAQAPAVRKPASAIVWFLLPYVTLVGVYLVFRWIVLASPGGDLDVLRYGITPIPFQKRVWVRVSEFLATFAIRFFLGSQAWTALALAPAALVAVALAGAARDRQVRRLSIGAVLVAGVFLAPGALGPAYMERLTYMSVAGVLMALALAIGAASRSMRAPAKAALSIIVVINAISWAAQSRAYAWEWQRAGEIADSLLEQLVQLEPAPASSTSLQFVDIPAAFGRANIFITYFHHSVRQRYGREDLDVVTHAEPLPQVIEKLKTTPRHTAAGSAPREKILFRWDAATEVLHRLGRFR